jgi:hypothetical protein
VRSQKQPLSPRRARLLKRLAAREERREGKRLVAEELSALLPLRQKSTRLSLQPLAAVEDIPTL